MFVGTVYTAEIAYDRNYRFIITFFLYICQYLKIQVFIDFCEKIGDLRKMLICMKMVLNQNISDNNKNSCSYNITANPIRRKRKAYGVGNITNKKEQSIMKNDNLTAQGRETLERFKMEAANEVGVNLRNGYNGDLSAREAGSIGGMMVKKMIEGYKQGLNG